MTAAQVARRTARRLVRSITPPVRTIRTRAVLACEPLEDRLVPASRPLPSPVIYTGAETGPAVVRGFDAVTGTPLFDRLVADPGFTGGVRVATADVTKDGYPDLIAALGPGGEPRVTVLDGKTGDPVPGPLGSFLAYAPSFAGGVGVAAGDLDGDGVPDVITAAGAGGGPHVRAFSGKDGSLLASFFAFEPAFAGGVSVSAADLTGDRRADLVVGAGAGGAPRVRVFDVATGLPLAGPRGSFFAFDPALRTGVSVATDTLAADVNADAVPDIAVGTGPGTAARVAVFSGKDAAALADFAPFAAGTTAGVRVALAYVDENATADVVAATGPGVPSVVRVFSGLTGQPVVQPTAAFAPFGAGSTAGVALAASNDPVVTSFTVTPQTQTVHAAEEEATVTLSLETAVPVGRVEFYDNWTGTGDIDHATVYPDSPGTTAAATFSHLYEAPGTYWQYVWAEVYDPDGNYVETAFWYADVTVVTAIGDYVWVDEDGDGLQDAAEPPAVGVRVDLYRDGTLVDTKFTNEEGKYLFDGLIPTGMYRVRVTNPDEYKYVFTTKHAVGAGEDSDVDEDGYSDYFQVPGARNVSMDAGLKPDEPRIIITKPDGSEVDSKGLKVAKWSQAFEMDGKSAVKILGPDGANLDFIDRDPDRFNVWVYDRATWNAQKSLPVAKAHIQAAISTKNVAGYAYHDDAPTQVDLVRYTGGSKGPGWFWSDSQMLVSNKIDDLLPAASSSATGDTSSSKYLGADESSPGADGLLKSGYTWRVSDRTHEVALRGTVRAEYQVGGNTVVAEAKVPPRKNVYVHVMIFNGTVGQDPFISNAHAIQLMRNANEQLAQVGIELIWSQPVVIDPPANVDFSNGLDEDYSVELQALLNGSVPPVRTADQADVELYFINYLTNRIKGESFPKVVFRTANEANSVIIPRDNYGPFTIPHEIGHLLQNSTLADDHYYGLFWPANLMRKGTLLDDNVESSKRLTEGQETVWLASTSGLLMAPN